MPAFDPSEPTALQQPMFKVPAGRSPSGRLVRARDASPEVGYRCPGCDSPLLLRRGPVRAHHFAHLGHGWCSPESALHKGAKAWLAQILRGCLDGRRTGAPRLRVPCAGNHGTQPPWRCPGEAWFSLGDLAFDEVALERTTPEGLRPDLLLLEQGRPVLGIEILVSHAVDAVKAARTAHPWVELEARRVLAAPRAWTPCQGRHDLTGQCPLCAALDALGPGGLSEVTGPGDLAAQVAAAAFQARVMAWLQPVPGRLRPAVCWGCPRCRRRRARRLDRAQVLGVALASSLGGPAHPLVLLQVADGPPIQIAFAFPANPLRPWATARLPATGPPSLRATPDLKRPHRLALNATNRPRAFICPGCGADCLGTLPSPPRVPGGVARTWRPFE